MYSQPCGSVNICIIVVVMIRLTLGRIPILVYIGAVALGSVDPILGLKALQVFPGIPPLALVAIPRTTWH